MRDFLSKIKALRVSKPVSTKFEITSYLKGDEPVILENVLNYPGFKITGNLLAKRKVFEELIGGKGTEFLLKFIDLLKKPVKYGYVDSAAFMENKVVNPDVLKTIPLTAFFPPIEKYYSTATIVLARDPETDRINASFHRLMYVRRNKLAIRIVPRDLYLIHQRNKALGRDTEVAVVCGVHPAICIAAATSRPSLNELEFANSILAGELKCVDLDGLDVPAGAEVVLRGRILRNELVDEGPFVDLTGTWDIVRKQPVIEVESIYFRENPHWQVILPGGPEHRLLMGIPQEPRIFEIVRNSVPTVKNVVLTSGGCNWLHAVVSIEKISEGEGVLAGLAALAAHPSLKRVIVVDEDIDVNDSEMVEWALATRLDPSRGVIVIRDVKGSSLDPSSAKRGVISKWIIDATIPLGRSKDEFKRVV